MPAPRFSPTVRQRRLAAELRRLREENDGRTAEQVAKALGWSKWKLTRLEARQATKPMAATVGQLLDLYGVTGDERDHILTLVNEARLRGWWQPYTDALTAEHRDYIGLEAEAWTVRNFESMLIPGLLQTEEYARLVVAGIAPGTPADTITALVAVRMERQKLLTSEHPPYLHALIDEAALRRIPPAVKAAQLRRLLEAADAPNIQIQVVPFDAGIHPGVGPFVVLSYISAPDGRPADAEVVYVDTRGGELFREDPAEVAQYTDAFEHLVRLSLSAKQTTDMIAGLLENLQTR